jgi:hypothetical protein
MQPYSANNVARVVYSRHTRCIYFSKTISRYYVARFHRFHASAMKAPLMMRAISPGAVLRMCPEYGKKLANLFCLLSDQRVAISGELLHVKNS